MSSDKSSIGDRMKRYEEIFRYYLMPRGYVCIRCDGRSFHNYCKHLKRPFDREFMDDMDAVAVYLCENIQGAKIGFVQSDEISIITSNFDDINTQMFFDGNIQKISSVVASMATARFNQYRLIRQFDSHVNSDTTIDWSILAEFDCRCWNVPNQLEAYHTLLWRQQDCIRNSVNSCAQSFFSHKELDGKSTSDKHEMLHKIGKNWATDYTDSEKNGRIIVKENYTIQNRIDRTDLQRSKWVSKGAWKFSDDNGELMKMIPIYE